MNDGTIYFRGYRCFNENWAGFNTLKPINVIVGRNNSGKSQLLELISLLCSKAGIGLPIRRAQVLTEELLKDHFPAEQWNTELGGRPWADHGQKLVGKLLVWELDQGGQILNIDTEDFDITSPFGIGSTQARIDILKRIAMSLRHPLTGLTFRHLRADRNIIPERSTEELELYPDGSGATNALRIYAVSAPPKYSETILRGEFLQALNEIFGSDGKFEEIDVKHHEEAKVWEIFLRQEKKGLVPLSNSGSGLKTVILVLLNLLIIPEYKRSHRKYFVFAFEELENNLHPNVIRRLFQFLEDYIEREGATLFLTTHSSTALDFFGLSKQTQIIHVQHDGQNASTATVTAHLDHLGIISDLGARPSDLLQANGIIWVEGPSDRIFINCWIGLLSNNRFREGRDYMCVCYGGALIAHNSVQPRDRANSALINLVEINPNVVVVCDGDQKSREASLKPEVERIRREIASFKTAMTWITEAREIENYLPGEVLGKIFAIENLRSPDQFESFFPRKKELDSYWEKELQRNSYDKVELATKCVGLFTKALMKSRFDWERKMMEILKRIESWNS